MDQKAKSTDQAALAAALLDPAVYGGGVEHVEKLETHISYVFLAGAYAYKVKKMVDLGFLDFSTLERRRFYCDEELRLNRRLAPGMYLDVVPISGTCDHPVLGGDGPPIEYAVKMRRFAQDCLLDALLARGRLTCEHIDRLAEKIAAFHAGADTASSADAYGTVEAIRRPALENFAQIRATNAAQSNPADLDALERWTVQRGEALDAAFGARKSGGFVRECHGDFHLGNAAIVDGDVTVFDCLEFDPNLRWIDVMNEVAFLVMDLHDRGHPDLAWRFLNRYLEITGDYAGLQVLRFYVVYRALVRAKIHALRADQPGVDRPRQSSALAEYRNYLALARRTSADARGAMILAHGLSGSGKTTHTQTLLEAIGAVRVRSDVERKRRHRLAPLARSGSEIAEGLYAADETARTYGRLADLAAAVIEAGYVAIVDATFLQRAQRDAFRRRAAAFGVPCVIADFVATEASLRARLAERARRGRDASEADLRVLAHQLQTQEPLRPDERAGVVTCDTDRPDAGIDEPGSWLRGMRARTLPR